MASTAIIYTGPTVKKLGLRNRAIYRGGLPEPLQKLVEGNSALAHQFVPLERYAKQPRTRVPGPVSNPAARKPVKLVRRGPPIAKT